jgi:branched-chain amino acid transport system substrate-binding protein
MKFAIIALIFAILVVGCVQQQNTIKIGALLPLSGQNSVYGTEIMNAIDLAKDEINSRGGINGKVLEIIYEDDKADPATGVSAMQKLVTTDGVPVVLGSWASGVVTATAPIAEENHVIVMAEAISPAITNAGDYIFRVQPSATLYTQKSSEFLRTRNISTIAIININNEFGKSLKDAFVSDFESRNGSVISIEEYSQGDQDFRTQLGKIKAKAPQSVFIAGYQDTINVIRQMSELGMTMTILAGPPFESKSTLDSLGNLAEGVIYAYHFAPGNEASKEYEQKYLQKYGTPTGGFAPLMYDATGIIADAMKSCNTNTTCIKQFLYSVRYEGVTGTITFDKNGDPSLPIIMKTVRNGTFVRYEG